MNLKELRITKGISPSFVAHIIGVTYRHFNRIERKGMYLNKEREKKLSIIYSTTIENIKECAKESKKL